MENPPRLLICWYSATGFNAKLARFAYSGARTVSGCETIKRASLRIDQNSFAAANAYLFIAPENFGQLCGGMRMMFERFFYPLEQSLQGRPYATITGCGNDGRGAVRDIDRICAGWRLRRVADPLVFHSPFKDPQGQQSRELGQALAEGLSAGIF